MRDRIEYKISQYIASKKYRKAAYTSDLQALINNIDSVCSVWVADSTYISLRNAFQQSYSKESKQTLITMLNDPTLTPESPADIATINLMKSLFITVNTEDSTEGFVMIDSANEQASARSTAPAANQEDNPYKRLMQELDQHEQEINERESKEKAARTIQQAYKKFRTAKNKSTDEETTISAQEKNGEHSNTNNESSPMHRPDSAGHTDNNMTSPIDKTDKNITIDAASKSEESKSFEAAVTITASSLLAMSTVLFLSMKAKKTTRPIHFIAVVAAASATAVLIGNKYKFFSKLTQSQNSSGAQNKFKLKPN